MNFPKPHRRSLMLATLSLAALSSGVAVPRIARAHDFRAGELAIDHPYALSTSAGITTGGVYLRGVRNRGRQADRLIGARTDRAARVEIHESITTDDIARMREVDGIDLPAGRTVQLRHGQRYHLMLVGLKQPLVDGERFELTLRFERNGEASVQVWVQTPADSNASHGAGHKH